MEIMTTGVGKMDM